jgi:hypothetical protein
MKYMLSLVAVSAIVVSVGPAFAMCGHDSAKLEQTLASSATAVPSEEEAASTFDPATIKKPVEAVSDEKIAE